MDESNDPQSGYLLPDKAYEILKWLALIALPAIAVFAQAVGPAWGLPHVDQIVATIDALGVLIGALIGVSEIKARLTA
ncbi:holin [Bifidobacterium sp. 64T4]|uniref:phage holin n=1 Tax=Bifidobacterium pongonis TaxID=2834432 RepID=UPI001C57C615|nr:phage holin [Bifidobacterium pongonis]MBW3095563.1 holin [Bifidobacterium pongonis]